jgi:Phosphoesterase family
MDRFVQENKVTPNYLSPVRCTNIEPVHQNLTVCFNPAQVMGYYDGNTVTALWNYAQHFAMSDSYYQTNYGIQHQVILILYLDRHMGLFQAI